MRFRKGFCRTGSQTLVWAGVLCMLCPWSVVQAANNPGEKRAPLQRIPIADVVLGERGTLVGQVIAADGSVKSDALVTIRKNGEIIHRTTSGSQGGFSVGGLSGGRYRIQAVGITQHCRLWTAGTAPPVAQSQLAVYEDQQVVRGQFGRRGCVFFSSPWFWGALVAVGIAVPLTLDDGDGS